MRSYLFAFLIALVLGLLLTPVAARLGMRLGAIDRTKDTPIPRAGGLAVVVRPLQPFSCSAWHSLRYGP